MGNVLVSLAFLSGVAVALLWVVKTAIKLWKEQEYFTAAFLVIATEFALGLIIAAFEAGGNI